MNRERKNLNHFLETVEQKHKDSLISIKYETKIEYLICRLPFDQIVASSKTKLMLRITLGSRQSYEAAANSGTPANSKVNVSLIKCDIRCVVRCFVQKDGEHMRDAAASHLQRARIICLFLRISLSFCLYSFLWRIEGRVAATGQPSALILICREREEPESHCTKQRQGNNPEMFPLILIQPQTDSRCRQGNSPFIQDPYTREIFFGHSMSLFGPLMPVIVLVVLVIFWSFSHCF